jgi:hypothetical protein
MSNSDLHPEPDTLLVLHRREGLVETVEVSSDWADLEEHPAARPQSLLGRMMRAVLGPLWG